MNKKPSIRRALLIRCGIGIGLLLCIVSIGIYIQVRRGLYRELDNSLHQTAALLANQIEYEDDKIIFEWQEGVGESGHYLLSAFYEYWNETSGESTRSPGLGSDNHLPKFTGPNGKPEIRDIQMPGNHRHARAIGMRVYPFVIPEEIERMKSRGHVVDPKSLPHILVVARDAKSVHRILTRVRWILAGGALTTMVIGYLMMELAIRISLRPIHKLSEEVRSRTGSPGDVNADLPADLPTELTGIVESFQALLVKVSAIRDRERDFIRHAAHELRTPIAGLRATTDLALSKPRDAATYEEQLKTCRQMAEELSELVKRLTALSRIGNETSKPPLRKLDIRSLLGEQIDRFQALFDERNLKLHSNIDASSPSHVMGNDTLIRLILNNLFDNVYSHAPNGSEAKVGLKRIGDELEISISNPAENLPSDPDRLFEPLFRNEESRHDSSSHLGIGLTLSQEAARSMGCSLSVETTPEGWIKFSFRLPIADS